MTWILLAEQEAATFKRVRAVLASHGWFLKTVVSRDQAFEVALEEPPRLVLVDESLPDAQDLVQAFASTSGGPGVILVGEGEPVEADSPSRADAILQRSFRTQELVKLVRDQLSTSGSANPTLAAPAQGRKFTTQEIFGDLLDDLLAPEEERPGAGYEVRVNRDRPVAAAPPKSPPPQPAATEETTPSLPQPVPESRIGIDRDVDDTLAGVLAETDPGLGVPFAHALEADSASKEVDALLTKTLADLDIREYSGVVGTTPAAEPLPARQMTIPDPAAAATPPAAVVMAGPPPLDQQRIGEYLLEEKIGVGGMAEVWMARRLGVEGFEKRVAIKKILSDPADDQAFIDMFIDEAKLAAQLTHNNITHIYELGRSGSDYFIAMEYVEGADLRKILNAARKQGKTVPAALALLITAKIAAALDYAHRKKDLNDNLLGLVHRDVSPRNVLISREGDVKLCDFGVAKATSKVATTQKGALKGKLPYMSPEQAWGKAVDSRSDIFSAGTLLFEMLTGQRLFDGESEIAILEAVRDCEIGARLDEHPDISSPLRAVLLEALAKSPDDRYQLAGDLQTEIQELLRRMKSKPGDSELAVFIQKALQTGEEAGEDSGPPPVLSPLEKLTRPVDPDRPGEHLQDDLEQESAILDMSAEELGAWTRWAPWAVTAVFLVLAFGAVAWWTFRPPGPSVSTGSGVESMAVGRRPVRLPFETGGAFHATDRSVANQPTSGPQEITDVAPGPGRVAPTPEPATPTADPIRTPPTFDGDTELQRQFEAELQRVEEILAASPLNGNNGGNATAPIEEPVAQLEPSTPPTTGDSEAEASPPEPIIRDISDESPPAAVEETAAPEPVIEQAPDTDTVAAPVTTDESPPELVEDATTPEPVIQQVPDTATVVVPASMPPPKSPAASDIATTASSTVTARASVAKTQPDRMTTARPDFEPRPTVKLGDLVEPGPGVVPPTPLEISRPQYPPLARRLRVQGTVRMSLLVDEAGRVIETRLLEGVPRKVGINEAALAAAAKARFNPATKEGIRVKMWYEMVSRFEL